MRKNPAVLTGVLVGVLLAAALTGVLALGDRALGLPFIPFDVLDWMARTLPGNVITFGIDTMVGLLRTLGLSVRDTAKTAEQIMAIAGLIVTAGVVGGVLFALLRALGERGRAQATGIGALAGLAFGVPITLISQSVNATATASPVVSAVWTVAVFAVWGVLAGWAYRELAQAAPAPAAAADAPSVEVTGRREFLVKLAAGSAAVTVVGAGLASVIRTREDQAVTLDDVPAGGGTPAPSAGGESAAPDAAANVAEQAIELKNPLPNAGAEPEPAPGTRPEYTPLEEHYRIDINARPPAVELDNWRLEIGGMVDSPLSLSLADLIGRYEPVHRFVTLSCISNTIGGDLISTTLWTGARLSEVLADAGVQPGAQFLNIEAGDGFHESLSLDLLERDDRIMLTYFWDGQPLTRDHGAPLRIYIPNRYGMKQPKWIVRMQVSDTQDEGYWVERGWSETAFVNATSVIDTVAANDAFEEDGQTFVPIGGIAYAGDRGISRVEVQMDEGDWTEAEVRPALSDTTWAIWRINWPFEEGAHTFRVRCYEEDGTLQPTDSRVVRPDGATGIDTEMASLEG